MTYKIEVVEFNRGNEKLLQTWQSLLEASTSPEKIHQTPAYFEFLLSSPATRDQAVLLKVSDSVTGDIKGIIPLRRIFQNFNFRISSRLSLSPRIKAILLLGSIPLVDMKPESITAVLAALWPLFPDISALCLSALPRSSAFNTVLCSTCGSGRYLQHVLDDWRDSHVIPLPDTFDAYLSRYNSKKRFNLRRQVRLLREHSGDTLTLHCIAKPEQVGFYTSAWGQLAPAELTRHILSPPVLQSLASNGLLHAYVLTINEVPCAVISATYAAGKLHVHNIIYDKELASFSVGVCILYLAVEDLIRRGQVSTIDLGYSNPAYSEQTSNVVETRGNMLVMRKTWRNRALCVAHDFYTIQVPVMKRILKSISEVQLVKKLSSSKSGSGG